PSTIKPRATRMEWRDRCMARRLCRGCGEQVYPLGDEDGQPGRCPVCASCMACGLDHSRLGCVECQGCESCCTCFAWEDKAAAPATVVRRRNWPGRLRLAVWLVCSHLILVTFVLGVFAWREGHSIVLVVAPMATAVAVYL